MKFLLLLVGADGAVSVAPLSIRQLREFPGGGGLSVHFRPVRNDGLFDSAKTAGNLAYRILAGEGIVRAQLWVEYEVLGDHVNVIGRSSDLLFALALITAKWKPASGCPQVVAATGILELDGTALTADRNAAVQSIQHSTAKVAAAVRALSDGSEGVVFFPAADAQAVLEWSRDEDLPPTVRLLPVGSLEEALGHLGMTLEKVYLGNPFRGLEPFEFQHRAIFFGREREVRETVSQLLRREAAGKPGVMIEGASGSGKSSFLRAGVLPALANPGSQSDAARDLINERPFSKALSRSIWRAGLLPPGAEEGLVATSILACWQSLPEFPVGATGAEIATLMDLVRWRRTWWPGALRFLWLIDQFEELFEQGFADQLIDRIGSLLRELQADGVWTVASVRADAVAKIKRFDALREVFGADEGTYYLTTLSGPSLDDVIRRPAEAAGLKFEMGADGKSLDEILRTEIYRETDGLPQLQFTLNELFLQRTGRELNFASYHRIGGLTGSISTAASAVFSLEDKDPLRTAYPLFRSLVSVDEFGNASRRYSPVAEITDPAQQRMLTRLVEARLCVSTLRDGQAVVAFAHESLLRSWPQLVDWLREEAGLLQTREMAQRETRLWQNHGESPAWLAAAHKVAAFDALEAADIVVTEPVRHFIHQSRQRLRRATRMRQAILALVTGLAIVASIEGWIAARRQHVAEYQTAETRKSEARLLVEAAAQRLKGTEVAQAQGIILEVFTNPAFAQGRTSAAINVFQEVREADAQLAVLAGHEHGVTSAVYSPDNTLIVTASADRTARIWDARSGAQVGVLAGHGDSVYFAAFSPDGTRIVTASKDKTARIWDARTAEPLTELTGHGGFVRFAAYSTDGKRIVTASSDKTARIWDAETGAPLRVLSGHNDYVLAAAYSPDGKRIVTASRDATARIWDARTGAQLGLLLGHRDQVTAASYSPDGSKIVTASADKTVRVWDARTGAQRMMITGTADQLYYSAVFSADGTQIVTASRDKTARIWDANTGAQLAVLSGHISYVYYATYASTGNRIVTASADDDARIWNSKRGAPLRVFSGHQFGLYSAAYSPDGKRMVSASKDDTARIWDTDTGATLAVLAGHEGPVFAAAFSPDNARVVTASSDKTAQIWDAVTGKRLAILKGHGNTVCSAAYSPDGAHIVTASFDKTARIWDAKSGELVRVLSGHERFVCSAAYSPDGRRILTASNDDTARIWDAQTGAQLTVLSGHEDYVSSGRFSPDGKSVVTSSGDGTARIWDALTGAQRTVLIGHGVPVNSAAYSHDGTRIVTASEDRTTRIWDAATGMQLAVLSGHDDFVFSAAYSPDDRRILTASLDKTARIWDANIPASLGDQIMWYRAAQMEPLSEVERGRLGLTSDAHGLPDEDTASACDRAAAAVYDPERVGSGGDRLQINSATAVRDCSAEQASSGHSARTDYQLGRAMMANGDLTAARKLFERARSEAHWAAAVDLADLLVSASAGMLDPGRAVALYEEAWQHQVPYAAFRLGNFYEHGISRSGAIVVAPDPIRAWAWYQKGADANEPSAIARFAERAERAALAETDRSKANRLLLDSFGRYSAAAERASAAAWPDDAWRLWRYRRATLARVLADDGMMKQVAEVYGRAQVRSIEPGEPGSAR